MVDAKQCERIAELGQRVLDGGRVERDEVLWLLNREERDEVHELMSWANRIRERFKGNQIHLCSIVNVKAGGCPENCKFCAQSAFYETESPRYSLVDPEPVHKAIDEAQRHGVVGLGLVAAWKGLEEGPILDQVCARLKEITDDGRVRTDASLGLIKSQAVADRLREVGVQCYNHNLETSRRYFPEQCSTHTYDDRLQTLRFLKQAGISLCCGGILGLGETREDRCDLALAIREVGASVVPINVLNPIPGTPYEKNSPLLPMEVLKTIACFRFVLPRQEIIMAGGRTVNLRDAQAMMFFAGASGLMVGNYLTTMNQPVEKDLQMIRDLGFDPQWVKHGFTDQLDTPPEAA